MVNFSFLKYVPYFLMALLAYFFVILIFIMLIYFNVIDIKAVVESMKYCV